MTDSLNSPAARLDFWLQKAIKPAAEARRYQQNNQRGEAPPRSVLAVWGIIWGLDPADPEQRIDLQGRGLSMIHEARRVRTFAERSEGRYARRGLDHFDQIEKAVAHFGFMEQAQITSMMDPITDAGWSNLRLLAEVFDEELPEPVLDDAQKDSLLQQTQALLAQVVSENDLSDDVKRQIADQLREVERALINATIEGTSAVERASNGLYGVMMRLYLRGEKIAKHPIMDAVLKLAVVVDLALNGAANYTVLAEDPIVKVLVLNPDELSLDHLGPLALPESLAESVQDADQVSGPDAGEHGPRAE